MQAPRHDRNGPLSRTQEPVDSDDAGLQAPPPEAPEWMTDDYAVAAWDSGVRILTAQRTLAEADLGALGRYCQFVAEWVTLTKDITDNGHTAKNRFEEERARPQVSQRDSIERSLRNLEKALGLDPAAHLAITRDLAAVARDRSKGSGGGKSRTGGFLNKKPEPPK